MSQESLQKSAQTVQAYLAQNNYPCKVVELAASTRTAQEAADALGCSVSQIVKSLIFKAQESGLPILVLASGTNRVNEKAIKAALGEAIGKADAPFVREVTGFAIGGIPPVGHTQKIHTFIDQDLLQYTELWAAAGTPHAVFMLNPMILQELSKGTVISIT